MSPVHLILLATLLAWAAAVTPGVTKVVSGGFGSGGQWIETGNRLDSFTPFPLGVCQAQTSTGRPIQAVGYPGNGATCNFQSYPQSLWPQLLRDGYVIAMSQDVYNGFHLADDNTRSPRSPLTSTTAPAPCNVDPANFGEGRSSTMCGQGCGECYLVTGPAGSQTYIVNEISDITVVGITQQGANLNLGWGDGGNGNPSPAPCRNGQAQGPGLCNQRVVNYNGPSRVTIKKVPCPVTGNIALGVRGFPASSPNLNFNIELTPMNFAVGITDMWARGRTATDADGTWKWLPRSWTNNFLHEPTTLFPVAGDIFEQSPTRTVDIRMRGVTGEVITCSAQWAPSTAGVTAGQGRAFQTFANCQFQSPVIDSAPCPEPLPENPVIKDQFYRRNGLADCGTGTSAPTGSCRQLLEGAFNLEWRDNGSFNLSPYPNYFNTVDCRSGSCLDTTAGAANQAGAVQLAWVQSVANTSFTPSPEFRFWAKCMSGTSCNGVTFGINNPCALVSSPPMSITNAWAEYTVDLAPLLRNCSRFNVIRFALGSNTLNRIHIDDAGFYCGGVLCTTPTTGGTTAGGTTAGGTTAGGTTAGGTTAGGTTAGGTTAGGTTAGGTTAGGTTAGGTTAGGTTVSPSTNSPSFPPIPVAPPGVVPVVPCPLVALNPGRRRFRLKLDIPYPVFDCALLRINLTRVMSVASTDLEFIGTGPGSTFVDVTLPATAQPQIDSLMASIKVGTSSLPVLHALDTNGNVVAPPAGVEAWVIAVAVVAALILAALVTVAIVLVVRHRKRNSGMNYTPLEEPRYMPMVSNPEPFLAPPPVATGSVACVLLHAVVDSTGDGTLLVCSAGTSVSVLPDDFSSSSDWCWVRRVSDSSEGYVPRNYLQRVK